MPRRGRRPHPDILTPREWEVLSLVREGLSNPQIGERLGISVDAAKYHVSEILSKLGLVTRVEAAAWRPEPAEVQVFRPAWARALGRWWPVLAWAGAAPALAVVGLLLWGVLRSNEDDALVANSGTPTAGGGPTATIFDPTRPVALSVGQPFPLTDQALILETGCNQCDGPTTGFVRVTATGDGRIQVDNLFDLAVLGYASRPVSDSKVGGGIREDKPYITGFGAAPDATEIWVSVCVREMCGSGGMDAWGPGSETVLLRSVDGGASWSEAGRVNNSGFIIALASPGHVLVGISDSRGQIGFQLYPEVSGVAKPAADASPEAVVEGHTVWRSGDLHRLWVDGEKVMTLSASESIISAFGITNPAGARPQLGVAVQTSGGSEFLIVEMNGEVVRHYDYDAFSLPAMEFGKGLVFGNATTQAAGGTTPRTSDYLPVAFDLTTNSIRPISQFVVGAPGLPVGRNKIIAAEAGPFAKIAGANPCAELHSTPSPNSEVLACLANDVLVVDVRSADKLVGSTPIDGWLDVLTLSGIHGYVRADQTTPR